MKEYNIPLVKDTINSTDIKNLSDWLLTNPRLTKGKLTLEFEKEWNKWNGNKYSIFVNSGSSANLLMVYALLVSGKLKNKKAIVPAVSWVTTVSPFIQLGLDPILCDCDKTNLGLDIDHFEELCKKHLPAVAIIVHVLGHTGNMDKILEICNKYGVILLEDCCESHGTQYANKKVGNFGKMASFSFYFGHHMSTIEGGMVVTDEEDLYNIMLSLRSHGWARDTEQSYRMNLKQKYKIDDFREKFTFYYPGFNIRSTDLNAFLGLEQLKRLDDTVQKRSENYWIYKKKLENYYWIQKSDASLISGFSVGLMADNLEKIAASLEKNSIETRPLICGSIGEQPFWIDLYGKAVLPNASKVHSQGFFVPCNPDLTKEEINKVCDVLIKVKQNGGYNA